MNDPGPPLPSFQSMDDHFFDPYAPPGPPPVRPPPFSHSRSPFAQIHALGGGGFGSFPSLVTTLPPFEPYGTHHFGGFHAGSMSGPPFMSELPSTLEEATRGHADAKHAKEKARDKFESASQSVEEAQKKLDSAAKTMEDANVKFDQAERKLRWARSIQ